MDAGNLKPCRPPQQFLDEYWGQEWDGCHGLTNQRGGSRHCAGKGERCVLAQAEASSHVC